MTIHVSSTPPHSPFLPSRIRGAQRNFYKERDESSSLFDFSLLLSDSKMKFLGDRSQGYFVIFLHNQEPPRSFILKVNFIRMYGDDRGCVCLYMSVCVGYVGWVAY